MNDQVGDNNSPLAAFVSRTEVFPEYVTELNVANGVARKHSVTPRYSL